MQTRPVDRNRPSLYPKVINEYIAPQNVSTLTTLLSATDLGSDYRSLCFIIENQDGANNVTLIVEASHTGTRFNGGRKQSITAAAGTEESIEVGEPNMYTFYRVSAQTDNPAFPVVAIRWAVLGLPR